MKLSFDRKSIGWMIVVVLLIFYVLLKIQAWSLAAQAKELNQKLITLRPTVSAILVSEQLERDLQIYTKVSEDIHRLDVKASPILEKISSRVPASVSIKRMEILQGSIWIKGTCLVGVRTTKEVLAPLTNGLQEDGYRVELDEIEQDPQDPTLWWFRLKAMKVQNA